MAFVLRSSFKEWFPSQAPRLEYDMGLFEAQTNGVKNRKSTEVFIPPLSWAVAHLGEDHEVSRGLRRFYITTMGSGTWRPIKSSIIGTLIHANRDMLRNEYQMPVTAEDIIARMDQLAAAQRPGFTTSDVAGMPVQSESFSSPDPLSQKDRDRLEQVRRITEERNRKYRR